MKITLMPSAKSVLILFGLTAAAAVAGIHKQICDSGIATLITSNK